MALSAQIGEGRRSVGAEARTPRGVSVRGGRRALINAGAGTAAAAMALREAHIACECAHDPADALSCAARGRFSLIVCAAEAPESEGFEMLERLSSLQPQAYVIALVPGASGVDAPELRALGVDVVLPLPVSPERLRAAALTGLGVRGAGGASAALGSPSLEGVPSDWWAQASDPVCEWSAMIASWLGWSRERVSRIWLAAGLRETLDPRALPPHEQGVLELARVLATCHGERHDGSGTPAGLRGAEIPVEARVLAVAETIADWLPSPMADDPRAVAGARQALLDEAGLKLDPELVALVLEGLS